jgi:hypothetical protein
VAQLRRFDAFVMPLQGFPSVRHKLPACLGESQFSVVECTVGHRYFTMTPDYWVGRDCGYPTELGPKRKFHCRERLT